MTALTNGIKNTMAKSKFTFTKEPVPTLDKSTIIEDFGWYEQQISLSDLLKKIGDKDPKDVYIELSFMNDPYSENPHLLLTGKKQA